MDGQMDGGSLGGRRFLAGFGLAVTLSSSKLFRSTRDQHETLVLFGADCELMRL